MDKSRKLLKLNMIFSLIYQIVLIVNGLILPKLILKYYGSEVNGLVNSIQSILNVITLMELGVGSVVQTYLYKPLVDNDYEKINRIVNAAKKFFYFVGVAFIVFVICICIIYPIYVKDKFDVFSTIILVISISLTLFSQYFFGIVNSLLIRADQKVYIINIVQIITLLLSTIICVVLIMNGFSIQIVKLTTSLIFLLRPLFLYFYVRKNYKIFKTNIVGDELPQKWNGLSQHIASYVLDNTDIVILTIFSSLKNVSIYSTYYMVVYSIRLLIVSFTNGIQSYYGFLYANNNIEFLKKNFEKFNYFINSISVIVYSVSCMMIVPFIICYTNGINDADYNQFLFGVILIISQFFFCLRRSYNILVLAVGHYKETQLSAIIEAIINVVVSICFVLLFDLIGVAIGTLVAMLYRTIYFAKYFSKKIICRKFRLFIKDLISDLIILSIAIILGALINRYLNINTFGKWIICSIVSLLIIVFVFTIVNSIIYKNQFLKYIKVFFDKIFKKGSLK